MCSEFDEIEFIALLNLEVKQMNVAFCNCQLHNQPHYGLFICDGDDDGVDF